MSRSERIDLQIDDMSCGHCVAAVSKALEAVPGVTVSDVRLGSATVQADLDVTTAQAIAKAVKDAGYEARVA
jgi:copper chaperone CopZ